MKYCFLLVSFLYINILHAQTNYYISSSGDDDHNGTSVNSPWKSIDKVNSMMSNFHAGDSILFKRGEEFRGELIITTSGSAGTPLNFSCYGLGNKPVINGAMIVETWTQESPNIWIANYTGQMSSLNNFFLDAQSQQIGRWPNFNAAATGYNSIDAFVGNSQLTDAALAGRNFTGATAIVRVRLFILNKPVITAHSGSTLTFAPNGTNYDMTVGDGYFIQNHVSTLDQQGEWCYDPVMKKIYLYSETNPNFLKTEAPFKSSTLSASNVNNISVTELKFVNANTYGLRIENSHSFKIEKCDFDNSHNAMYLNLIQNAEVNHNTINNTNNNAIWLAGTFYNCNYNIINNTALRPGMGEPNNNQYNAINMVGADATVMGNRINKVGYCGIRFEGSRLNIKNNVINEFALTKSDVGAIYSFKGFAPASYGYGNNIITGNMISNGVPNLFGTRAIPVNTNYAVGIYMDQNTVNNTISKNTVYNCNSAGFMINEGANSHVVRDNVFYNNMFGFAYFPTVTGPKNFTVKNNIWFSKHPSQIAGMSQATNLDYMKNFGSVDSNYFAQPFEQDSVLIQTNENYATRINKIYSLYDWSKLGYDRNSSLSAFKVPPYTLTSTGANSITNGTFNSGISGWSLTPTSGSMAPAWDNSGVLDGGCIKLSTLTATGLTTSRASVAVGNLQFGNFYEVRFSMKGVTDTARLKVVLFGGHPVAKYRYVKTSTQRKEVSFMFTPVASINNVSLQLTMNDPGNQVWIDNVQFKPLTTTNTNPDDHLFFAVNDNSISRAFDPGPGVYKDIKGNIYNGSFTLPAYSSAILMKSDGTLPLDLINFYGFADGCNANLQWSTENVKAVKGFEIQYSIDGKPFQKQRFIPVSKSGTYKDIIAQIDESAYYRLKIVDEDGSSKYSNVIHVSTICNQEKPMIFPNPVKDTGVLNYNSNRSGRITYAVINASGQVVVNKKIPVLEGKNLLNLDTSSLAAGYYVLSVTDEGKTSTSISFVKQ